jgi:hypothetical protein
VEPDYQRRYFTSYTGVTLPLTLVTELDAGGVERRITCFRGYYDGHGQLIRVEKVVYGEIEFTHQYDYAADGSICKAVLTEDDEEPRTLVFDDQGAAVEA